MYIVIFYFIVFIVSALMFHTNLKTSREMLSSLNNYSDINWLVMYSDGMTQLKILKAIRQGKTATEVKLKILFFIQFVSFLMLFISMSLLLVS